MNGHAKSRRQSTPPNERLGGVRPAGDLSKGRNLSRQVDLLFDPALVGIARMRVVVVLRALVGPVSRHVLRLRQIVKGMAVIPIAVVVSVAHGARIEGDDGDRKSVV